MKYPVIFLLATLFFLAGCAKEPVTDDRSLKNQSVDLRSSNLVHICHHTGNGEFIAIEVNESAVPAHLAHGDYLPDADGDGYTAVGACSGSMDDCDDTNPNVHPGAAEICDNGIDDDCDGLTDADDPDCSGLCVSEEILNSANEFTVYYNAEENNCLDDEFPIALAIVTDQYIIYTVEFEGLYGFLFGSPNELQCVGIVGENITEEQYQSVGSMILAVIAAHPEMPNLCEEGLRQPDSPQNALMRREKLLGNMKKGMPEKLRIRLENK